MGDLSFQSETKDDISVMKVAGRIDSETSPAFDTELTRVVGKNPRLVLNCQDVSYLSSAGIRAIVKASQAAAKNGGAVKLVAVPESVNSVLYTVGLNQKLGSYASVDEALSSF